MRQIFGRAALLAVFAQSFLPSFTAVYAAEFESSLGDSVATPALVEWAWEGGSFTPSHNDEEKDEKSESNLGDATTSAEEGEGILSSDNPIAKPASPLEGKEASAKPELSEERSSLDKNLHSLELKEKTENDSSEGVVESIADSLTDKVINLAAPMTRFFRAAMPRSALPTPVTVTENAVETAEGLAPALDREELMKKAPALIAKELGINWDKDRAFYAKKAGIANYTGTAEQNEKLKEYLVTNANNLPSPDQDEKAPEGKDLTKKGKTTVDVREATPDGSLPRTDFWVGEQINTNAVIDNSWLGETLYARARLVLPRKHLAGEPVFVQETNMRDYVVSSDADNRYVDFKITVEDGKKVALPVTFTVQNNSTVPQWFKTPITFSLYREDTDELIDERTTVYTSKVLETKVSLMLDRWSGRYFGRLWDAHGTGDVDDDGDPRRTAVMRFVDYSGSTAAKPDLEKYTGWADYYIRQEVGGGAPSGLWRSFPDNNHFVVRLPQGVRPFGSPDRETWKYCYHWAINHCWTYDEDNNIMEMDGKFWNNERVKLSLSYVDQPYYDDAEKTKIHYNKIEVAVTSNPNTEYEHHYGVMKSSIGWVPKIEMLPQVSRLETQKDGFAQSLYHGIPYTTNHQEYDQKNTLFYTIATRVGHTFEDQALQREYTLYWFTDHTLDDRMYYRSLSRNRSSRQSSSGGKGVNETPHKIYGILENDSEVLLKQDLEEGEVLQINDVEDKYKAIKVVFDSPIVSKVLNFNMNFYVGVKESAWTDIEGSLLNIEEKKLSGWGDFERKWQYTDEYDHNKFFNSATFEYSDPDSTEHKTVDKKGYLFFKKDYITSSADKWNGDYIVPYNLDPLAMQREIFSWLAITKNIHDASPWTDYAKTQLWINGLKYLALLPEGIDYLSWSVGALSTVVDGVPLPEPKVIPNYKDTGKTGLIFDLWDIKVDQDWFVHRRKFKFKVQVTNKANEGDNFVDGYFYWGAAPGWIPGYWANYKDKLDLDGDGEVEEMFHKVPSTRITYVQWRDIVLKNWLSPSLTGNFASSAVLDASGAKPYYKLNLFNNYIEDMKGLSLIATLPRVNDLAIVPDQDWNYPPRGSDLALSLSGSLEKDPANAPLLDKWKFLYSTDLTTTIDATKNANWVTADQIQDFSKVTMVKMVQKSESLVRQKENMDFYFPIKMPDNLPDQARFLSASASAAFSTNNKTYIESNKITFSFVPHYRVQGKVFADIDDNGSYSWDVRLKDYKVSLHYENGDVVLDEEWHPMVSTTDQDGGFFFKVLKRGRYYLSMVKKFANEKVAKLFEVNDVHVVWSWGNDAVLDPTDLAEMTLRSGVFNLDPYSVSSENDIYKQPSSLLAIRNFGLVPQNGKIRIKLTDFDDHSQNIEGAKYYLYNDQGDKYVLTTNKDGEVESDIIPFGTYTLEQVSSDARHMITTTKEQIELSSILQTLTLTNKVKRSGLTIELTDSVDGSIKLKEWVYELRDHKWDLISTLTTDKNGTAYLETLSYGEYTLKQITAPKYYSLFSGVVRLLIDGPSKHQVLTNVRKSGNITLTLSDARDSNKVLEGGKFSLVDSKGHVLKTWLTTDKKGQISVSDLPYGDYILVQSEAPAGYTINGQEIKVGLFVDQQESHHVNRKRRSIHEEVQPKPEPRPHPKQEIEKPIVVTSEPKEEEKIMIPSLPTPIKTILPDPITYRELLKEVEVVQSGHGSQNLSKTSDSLIKTYVKRLPKTGALGESQLHKKVGVVSSKTSSKVETRLPSESLFRLAGDKNTDLAHWLSVLPHSERSADQYVVLPTQWLVMPIQTVASGSAAYNNFVNGKNEDFLSYLHNGAVQLPATSRGTYGDSGNKVIAGHSSYRKSSTAKYKTNFQKIIGMEAGEQVWIYKKNSSGVFTRYVYQVEASYNTSAKDVSILYPTTKDQVTLMTCTPIGGVVGRRIVKATFVSN